MAMGTSVMPMEHGSMSMQHMTQKHEKRNAMPCEQCEKEHEQIAAFFSPLTERVTTTPLVFSRSNDHVMSQALREIVSVTLPPPDPPLSLVGTVILRT